MSAAPGWYPDSLGETRYWDGQRWHATVAPVPAALAVAAAPLPAASVPGSTAPGSTAPGSTALAAVPQPVQPVYAAPTVVVHKQSNGLAVAGFVLGLVSVFMPLVIGFVMAGAGLGLSIGGLARAGRIAAGTGLSVAGLVLSIVGLVLII